MGSLGGHFGVTLGSLWVDEGYLGAPWVAWNPFWGPFGALWDHFGAIWEPLLAYEGDFEGHFGVTLGSI